MDTFLYARIWVETFGRLSNALVGESFLVEYLNRICVLMNKMWVGGLFRQVFLRGFFGGPKRFLRVFERLWLQCAYMHACMHIAMDSEFIKAKLVLHGVY